MKTLTVYGASDDLVESEGLPGCDECWHVHRRPAGTLTTGA